MRWCLLILLLINGLYFAWQLPQSNHHSKPAVNAQVATLRLLNEADRSLLLARHRDDEGTSQAVSVPAENLCWVVGEINSEMAAHQLQAKLVQLGLISRLASIDVEQLQAYELILARPKARPGQQALETRLTALGLSTEVVSLGDREAYVLGRYDSLAALRRVSRSIDIQPQPIEFELVKQTRLFEVSISADRALETDNKIKEVADLLNSSMKIEKKVCKGVASAEVRD
ncbi:hypothetical protein Q4488_17640 [Amphritea sp. 1_MG-2023]|uniref:hypothetical protein n=1 Tax=Amphritea sp. 1_MG-2023 TaxID=3062670 RepID=UPI0026E317CB|nr:hypothetical protein [Amphritea sp. 1_MG-2023]MDO6565203.1 hypothetical protein [Amphritea sp. 1_MG-2023]